MLWRSILIERIVAQTAVDIASIIAMSARIGWLISYEIRG